MRSKSTSNTLFFDCPLSITSTSSSRSGSGVSTSSMSHSGLAGRVGREAEVAPEPLVGFWDSVAAIELVDWLRKGFSNAFLIFLTLTCPNPGRFWSWSGVAWLIFAKLYRRSRILFIIAIVNAYSKVHSQCFDVGFVYFAYCGEGATEDWVVIFFNSFLDETRGLELKLLVCCQVMSCFFVSYDKKFEIVVLLQKCTGLTRMQLWW
jgi:hypothetical protein